MAKTGHYIHVAKKAHTQAFTNAYDVDKQIDINLWNNRYSGASIPGDKKAYTGNIQLIRLDGTITGGASTITLKGYLDTEGNELVIPPSSATLESSLDGTKVSAVYQVNAYHAENHADLYFFAKTNQGTFTCSEIVITWFE